MSEVYRPAEGLEPNQTPENQTEKKRSALPTMKSRSTTRLKKSDDPVDRAVGGR
jgi:hypothetical protein